MKLNCYAIFDSATNAYMRPFFMQSDGQANRSFADEAVRADSEISKHPEDYSLFRVGTWDDNEGSIEPCDPKCIGRAHELAAASRVKDDRQLEAV
jgi:hypothetical protein